MLHGIVDGSGEGSDLEHLNRSIFELHQFQQPPKALKKTGLGGAQSPPLFVLIFLVLFYFILISLIFLLRFSLIFS